MNSKQKVFVVGFWTGIGSIVAIYGLVQDIVGKEIYIQYISKHWIDLPPAVFFIGLVLWCSLIRWEWKNLGKKKKLTF